MSSRFFSPWSKSALASLVLALLACGRAATPPSNGGPAARAQETPKVSPVAVAPTPSAEVLSAIDALLSDPKSRLDASPADRKALATIYPDSTPLWIDGALRLTKSGEDALAVLSDAASEGLEPKDYRADSLKAQAGVLEVGPAGAADAALFDVSLSHEMMRYLRQFHRGRVNPRDMGFEVTLPSDEHDYAALARDAARQSRVKETVASVAPPLVQYQLLRSMLPRYRTLAQADGTTLPPLPEAPAKPVKPGGIVPGLEQLRTRLIALGDLPQNAPALADATLYDGEIVEGVKRFQNRHGYEPDGVLGKATWAALNVPLAWRLRQIELAMERMRWLPHLGERPFIAVNIPMFRLWAWDHVPENGAPDFGMGVIVGKALDTRTPVFLEEMEYLIFRPYWNVPKSILQKEILPILHRNPAYLDKEDMEIVDGPGDEARPVAARPENINRLAEGELRLRQRPGPKNSLGQLKFMFPNDENVYLHGTPAPQLFGRARRDFSHGCVRVEDPPALAQWALRDQPEWTKEKIVEAMNGTPSFRIPLKHPIRVVMYYVTAAVIPDENAVHFADDIYGHDPRLDRALITRKR